ncbi:hypothetical protein L208DRAFT_557873 [Tricholoma matsutake]|nr:hypothetical protein L208DRAFT_557873 [Tricholoma matsutake 945]
MCAINTIAHNALGDPLWTTSRGVFERVNWFGILCSLHFEDVSSNKAPRKTTLLMILQLNRPSPVHSMMSESNSELKSSLFHLLSPSQPQENTQTTSGRYTLPSLSNVLNHIDSPNLMLRLPSIVSTNFVEQTPHSKSFRVDTIPKLTADVHEEGATIGDSDNAKWMDLNDNNPASPPITDISSSYDMYDWNFATGSDDDEMSMDKAFVTSDFISSPEKVLSEEVQKPMYSLFTETKKRAEKCRQSDEVDGGGKEAVDYKSQTVLR